MNTSLDKPTQLQRIHNRRVLLRNKLRSNPKDGKALTEYYKSYRPVYVRMAAENGIFISYTPTDAIFAVGLTTDLGNLGLKTWMDELDAPHDGDWAQAIDGALERCGVMLLVVTPASLQDSAVQSECQRFLSMGKAIIPVMPEFAPVEPFGLYMDAIDFIDDYERGFHVLLPLLTNLQKVRT